MLDRSWSGFSRARSALPFAIVFVLLVTAGLSRGWFPARSVGAAPTLTTTEAAGGTVDSATSASPATTPPILNKNVLAVTKNDGSAPPATEGRVLATNTVTNSGAGSRTANRTAQAAVGDIVTFQLEYVGSPDTDQKNIVITDILPTNYAFVTGSVTYNNVGPYSSGYVAYTGGVTSNLTSSPLTWTLTGTDNNNITPTGSIFRVQFQAQVTAANGTANDNLGTMSG